MSGIKGKSGKYLRTLKHLQKMSEVRKGRHLSPKSEFKKGLVPWNKGIPVPDEQKKRQALSMRGKLAKEKHPMWGKHHSAEAKEKIKKTLKNLPPEKRAKMISRMSLAKIGYIPWNKGKKNVMPTPWNKGLKGWRLGHPVSFETRRKLSKTKSKGLTAFSTLIRHSFEYRQWVSDVFQRDDYTCLMCQERGGKLNAHHIKSFSKILKENHIKSFEQALQCAELWNINNGQTLCIPCHKTTDTYLNKKK